MRLASKGVTLLLTNGSLKVNNNSAVQFGLEVNHCGDDNFAEEITGG